MCESDDEDLDLKDSYGIHIGAGVLKLEKKIHYSGFTFTHIQMDLRHINFGTQAGGRFKSKKRSNYSKDEVIKFLEELDGVSKDQPDNIFIDEYGLCFRYKEIINSPIEKTKDIEYLLVFDVYEIADDTLICITLFSKG